MGEQHTHHSDRPRVCGIVVTYHPDPDVLTRAVAAVLPQVDTIVLADNTPGGGFRPEGEHTVIHEGENIGLPAAYNKGVRWASEQGFSHILLLDQDSVAGAGMVAALCRAEGRLRDDGAAVAAVGPQFTDPKYRDPAPFVRLDGWLIRKERCRSGSDGTVLADYLISSGTLIACERLNTVGPMDEDLFIDYVDVEWGLRAAAKGYQCYGVCDARMEHDLGERSIALWFRKWREVPVHTPLRHYYLFRNAIALCRRDYIPWRWKLNDLYRLVLKFIFYATITPPRWEHAIMMSRGIRDGLYRRMGPGSD